MDLRKEISNAYGIDGEISPYGNGLINDTYICGDYIIQRINISVFTNPEMLMENVEKISVHIRNKLAERGEDPDKGTITVVRTLSGDLLARLSDGQYYRVTKLIENSISYEIVTADLLYKAAYGFGKFQKMLSDFDSSVLYETIKDFHNTPARYSALLDAVKEDRAGRVCLVQDELNYIYSCEKELSVVTDKLASGEIPTRVTHNDTKINNVLFDKDDGRLLAVIDLDTVMSGSLLYDFGDAVRSAANAVEEDERDLSKVRILYCNFEAFAKGFLEAMGDDVTDKEKELLPFSVKLLALELGIRFLTDYINGDVYFKTSREGHNLDRARCQLQLARKIEEGKDRLAKIIADARGADL